MDVNTAWVAGKFGNALEFDGVDDYVEVPDSDSLDITDAITVEAWVNPNSLLSQSGARPGIVNKKSSTYYNAYELWIEDDQLHFRLFYNNDGSYKDLDSTTSPFTIGQWTHIVGTYDGTYMRIYADGNEIGNKDVGAITIDSSDENLFIGAKYWGGYEFFNGSIDDVAIYNRALSADEIIAHYNDGVSAHFDNATWADITTTATNNENSTNTQLPRI
jgi:hypothetical protein